MKKNNILIRIAFSPFILAIIPTLVLFLFLPSISSKYKLEIQELDKFQGQMVYEDLNGDSITECIQLTSQSPFNSVVVLNNKVGVYDQWNIPDTLSDQISGLYFGDYDHNGYKEIYIFSLRNDSLFLNVNEFFKRDGLHLMRKFITRIQMVNGAVISNLFNCGFNDRNGDGKDEYYFGIQTGYGREPRRIYCFDLKNQRLYQSMFTGNIPFKYSMEDLDGDSKPEIFGYMNAPGNYKTKVPFSDSSTWLMVFDDQLSFKFDPVEFRGFTNSLSVLAFHNNANTSFVLLHVYGGVDSTVLKPCIMFYSSEGKLISKRTLKDIGIKDNPTLLVFRRHTTDEIVLVEKKIFILNDQLKIEKKIDIPFHSSFRIYQADINNDGNDELFLYSNTEEKLAIYSPEIHILTADNLIIPGMDWQFSHSIQNQKEHKLFLKAAENGYFLQLKKNKYFILGYISYAGIYLAFFLFILLIRKITTYQLAQRDYYKRRLLSLQLQSIKGQLDPHFTFNALNSIAALIYTDDRQSAYDHMNKFTQLLRRMLNDADKIYRSLKQEIEFVTTYLDLEKLRFGDKFTYEIIVGTNISQEEQVPKMVLQTFAENAIKHGIMPCSKGGKITISIQKENNYLKLIVEDNGIGRQKAAGNSTSTGKGLKLTDEFYEILNQINERSIRHTITDLYDNANKASGTRVEVWVPVNE